MIRILTYIIARILQGLAAVIAICACFVIAPLMLAAILLTREEP